MATTPNELTRQQLDDLDALLQRMLSVPIAEKDKPAASTPPTAASMPTTPAMTSRLDPPAPAARQPHIAPASVPAATVAPSPAPVIFESRIDARSFVRPEAMPTPSPIGPSSYDPPSPTPATRLFGSQEPVPSVVEQRTASVTVEPVAMNLDPEPNITVEPPLLAFQQAMNQPGLDLQDSAIPLTLAETPRPEVPLIAAPAAGKVPILAWPLYGCNRVIEGCLNLFGPPGELLTTGPVKWVLGLAGIGLLGLAAAWSARGMGWVSW